MATARRELGVLGPAERGDVSTLRRLLRAGDATVVDLADRTGRTALIKSAAQGRVHIVQELLAWGAALDVQDSQGLTALMAASYSGHAEVVALLLAAGASVNAASLSGRTALHKAAYFGHTKICELLVDHGADMDAVNGAGGTAVIGATFNAHESVVRFLVSKGALIDVRNNCSKRAVDYAQSVALRTYLTKEDCWRRRRMAAWLTSDRSGGGNIMHSLPEDVSRYIIAKML